MSAPFFVMEKLTTPEEGVAAVPGRIRVPGNELDLLDQVDVHAEGLPKEKTAVDVVVVGYAV